jgi:peptide/nickel transport system substrate-binding protein
METGNFNRVSFANNTLSMARLHCDIGPMQFKEVRQALAWCWDRDENALLAADGHAIVVNSQYLPSMWIFQDNREWLEDNLIHHTVNINRAREILIEGGWVLNAAGGPFVEGTDEMRFKNVDGELMGLELWWASNPNSAEGNARFRSGPVHEAAKIGMVIREESVQSVTAASSRNFMPDGVPKYHIFIQGSSYSSPIAYWNTFQFEDERLFASSNSSHIRSQTLNDLSLDMMRTDPFDKEEFERKWLDMLVALNDYLPNIYTHVSLTSSIFHNWLQNYNPDTFWSFPNAIVRAYIDR